MIDNPCEWGASTLLVFSANVGELIYYSHVFPLVISLFLGIQVLISNPSKTTNRLLFAMTAFFATWVYFDLILWASPTPESVIFFWKSIVIFEILMYLAGLHLIYNFTRGHSPRLLYKVLFFLPTLPIFLFAHTSLSVVGLSPDCDEGAFEGVLIQYMYFLESLIIIAGVYFIATSRKHLHLQKTDRYWNLWLSVATIIFLIFFWSGNLTLSFDLNPLVEQYKLFSMPNFAALVAYGIIRHSAFGVKAILTDVLLATMWMAIFSTLLLENMSVARPVLIATLLTLSVIAIGISRSVKNEIKQKNEIAQLATELEQANKRLKQLDKAKSEFVSIASHQLRSPLTSMRGYASMLLDGSYGTIPAKANEAVQRIADSSKFMARMVENYLNVSRIESGNMKYELSDFNLATETEKIVDDKRQEAVRKGILLTYHNKLQRQGLVHADIGKTQEIIHNLLNNALKYTPKGSIDVLVHDDVKKKVVHVDITDSGIGMSTDDIDKLFGKFERAANANSVNTTGTGLGLYVARTMALAMQGDITAFSEGEGSGSTFRITLPLI